MMDFKNNRSFRSNVISKTRQRLRWLFQHEDAVLDDRTFFLCALAIGVGVTAAFVARSFLSVINFFTNLSFYGKISIGEASPAGHHLRLFVLAIPAVGGLIVGLMARYGSKAIRGHGIPEAMEQVLLNQSRIPPRVMVLKLVSSAISIGTGGPFGAEGPIIATGGALGSIIGQALRTTANERKTILAAGAAAGMAATFGSPVSAAILAIELLLFEYHARSFIPVALASVTAGALRARLIGPVPMFPMPVVAPQPFRAVIFYIFLGLFLGLSAVIVTRATFLVEDEFEKLPVHWMWWPVLGGIVVGVIGFFYPRTLGVGYDNIQGILTGDFPLKLLLNLCFFKFLSWVIALGSGTSGGTLAPLFTIGGALGASIGMILVRMFPHAGANPGVSALVGMAAMFAGSSRAVLASIIFALETTHQPMALMPLLGGCTASYLVSCLLMQNSIMTEKIERRGVRVPLGYTMDFLSHAPVKDYATFPAITLNASETVGAVRAKIESGSIPDHKEYPILEENGSLAGVIMRTEVLDSRYQPDQILRRMIDRKSVCIGEKQSLRDAIHRMLESDVSLLPVLDKDGMVTGVLSRGDIFSSHKRTIAEDREYQKTLF